jgi:hypothetical protein
MGGFAVYGGEMAPDRQDRGLGPDTCGGEEGGNFGDQAIHIDTQSHTLPTLLPCMR